MADEKTPKEASELFHKIMKASMSPKATGAVKKKEVKSIICSCLIEKFSYSLELPLCVCSTVTLLLCVTLFLYHATVGIP